ncbi:LemA family protein, partial [Candidatus Woesearchaeota archaeon CG_4_10_14_0_2_um_filter_57_5]
MARSSKEKKPRMGLIVTGVVLIIVLLGIFMTIGVYNSVVRLDEQVQTSWAQVENQFQRRVDLIPNLVATVQGAADFEKSTLTEITALRSQWQTASTIDEKAQAATGIERVLSRLLVVAENYPTLKSNQNFLALQDELANTENKIAVERGRYNDAVRAFNTKMRTFPTNIIA